MLYSFMSWTVQIDDDAAKDIRKLPRDLSAKLFSIIDRIEAVGLDQLPPKTIKNMGDDLWELRVKGKSGIARAFYFTIKPKRVIVLSAFVKKSQQTPKREIAKARQRMKGKK